MNWKTFSTKLDLHPKIYDPNDNSIEQDGNNPTFYNTYILREVAKKGPTIGFSKHNSIDGKCESGDVNEILSKVSDRELQMNAQNTTLKLKKEIFPRILFLGTGAADSYDLRNSSGTLVHLSWVSIVRSSSAFRHSPTVWKKNRFEATEKKASLHILLLFTERIIQSY